MPKAISFVLLLHAALVAQEPFHFFETKIRPVLVEHCYKCHSLESGKSKGDLRLDSREAIRKGGERGPGVVPGSPEKSVLLDAIFHREEDMEMPPKKQQLPKNILDDFVTWIEMGAPDPRNEAELKLAHQSKSKAQTSWSLLPPKISTFPKYEKHTWVRRPLDTYILKALHEKGLSPSPDAQPGVLLRRLYLDLIGLLPTPQQQVRFNEQIDRLGLDAALENEVDQLLARPEYGEHWARHWLDVVRYAESTGKETNLTFPHAWRYRNYVIQTFNEDLPYDRFILEQLAGDLLPYKSPQQRARHLISTGLLAFGPKSLEENNTFQHLADLADEQLDTVMRAFTASSVACARCHDHKSDPYTMEDYYALAGIFASSQTFFGTSIGPGNTVGGDYLVLPKGPKYHISNASIPLKKLRQLKQERQTLLDKQIQNKNKQVQAFLGKSADTEMMSLQDALRTIWRLGAIEGQLKKVDEQGKALPLAMGVQDRKNVFDIPVLERGDITKAGDKVPRGFPKVIILDNSPTIPKGQSGRLQLAHWLTHPKHPLTSRVMVNRLWHHLFGRGLVKTVDNFGSSGEKPSHPELLDHLAIQFIESNWSIKNMIKSMVLSRTYRQESIRRPQAEQLDPDNTWLWRAPRRRMTAEMIRDSILQVSGELETGLQQGSTVSRMGEKNVSLVGFMKHLPDDLDGAKHRSVYLPIMRNQLPDILELFDFAEPSLVSGTRDSTNVPLQALFFLNSEFMQTQSENLAKRIQKDKASWEEQLALLYQSCYGREPNQKELNLAQKFFGKHKQDNAIWDQYCHAILSTLEFRSIE